MKTYHKFKLKDGTQVVLARSSFNTIMGYQVCTKSDSWNAVRMTVSKDEDAVSTIVDRKNMMKHFKHEFRTVITKLRNL